MSMRLVFTYHSSVINVNSRQIQLVAVTCYSSLVLSVGAAGPVVAAVTFTEL